MGSSNPLDELRDKYLMVRVRIDTKEYSGQHTLFLLGSDPNGVRFMSSMLERLEFGWRHVRLCAVYAKDGRTKLPWKVENNRLVVQDADNEWVEIGYWRCK